MKILIYADPHWSQYSSILRQRGDRYSVRLENLIKSLDWVEQIAEDKNCDMIVCLGDFFDKSELNAEELTALSEVSWSKNCVHKFLVGNHEMAVADNSVSSAHVLKLIPHSDIIDSVCHERVDSAVLTYLPYILEDKRKSFTDYIENTRDYNIVFSHNDLQIQYGMYKSTVGFTAEEVENACNLFFNGHLHNKDIINKTIINVGNLTGQNFSEDATKYAHGIVILDVEQRSYEYIENPYAINFYKLTLDSNIRLKDNAVVSLTAPLNQKSDAEYFIKNNDAIIASRIVVEMTKVKKTTTETVKVTNHIEQFMSYVTQTLGDDSNIVNELKEVCQ